MGGFKQWTTLISVAMSIETAYEDNFRTHVILDHDKPARSMYSRGSSMNGQETSQFWDVYRRKVGIERQTIGSALQLTRVYLCL